MSCHVCGASEAESHFGGITCRACAAFFRRYYHSKKSVISCTCKRRFQNSHPCRECRMQKCLSIGMTPEKVQHKRERHPQKSQKPQDQDSIPSSSSQSPPSLPISPLPQEIVLRDNTIISNVVSKWVNIQDKRRRLYGKRLDEVTYYETIVTTKSDCDIMWSVIEMIFPQVDILSNWDKSALLRNFHPKWSLLVAAIDLEKNQPDYAGICTQEDYTDMVVKFWTQSVCGEVTIGPNEIMKIFEPFLYYYACNLTLPIHAKQFDPVEYMALTMMVLFDGAHTNISPECSKLCYTIKNLILRELRGYHIDKNCGEMRFIETIDVIQLLQKGESKFQEELLICEMYNFHIHDDYRLMMKEHNC